MKRNEHIEHIEDLVFNDGVNGARAAINYIQAIRDTLAGSSDKQVDITVKWDGSPSIFFGVDPEDGQRFVAKKSVFNVNPKVYKSQEDIDQDLTGDIQRKFSIALRVLSQAPHFFGVYQGDMMFTKSDIRVTIINNKPYYTFQPNTIVYAVPVQSNLGRQIKKAELGIVWHTKYQGSSLKTMEVTQLDNSIAHQLGEIPGLWHDDAGYKDQTGYATFTQKETKQITSFLAIVGKTFNQIPGEYFTSISTDKELKNRIKIFNNLHVRAGKSIDNLQKYVMDFQNYLVSFYQQQIDEKKTEQAKQRLRETRESKMQKISGVNAVHFENVLKMMIYIQKAKLVIINKLNTVSQLGTFLRTTSGLQATNPEGYVAVTDQGTVKLIDRLEFSYNNFDMSIQKGWSR